MIVITINIVIELIEPTIVKPCLVLIHSIMILISIKMIMMIIVITRKKEIVLSLPCVTKERVMQRLSILGFFAQDIMITWLHKIVMIKLNEPGVRLSFVLDLQLNSVLAQWTHLCGITINIDIIIVVIVVVVVVVVVVVIKVIVIIIIMDSRPA